MPCFSTFTTFSTVLLKSLERWFLRSWSTAQGVYFLYLTQLSHPIRVRMLQKLTWLWESNYKHVFWGPSPKISPLEQELIFPRWHLGSNPCIYVADLGVAARYQHFALVLDCCCQFMNVERQPQECFYTGPECETVWHGYVWSVMTEDDMYGLC